jgi:hypothetical protein
MLLIHGGHHQDRLPRYLRCPRRTHAVLLLAGAGSKYVNACGKGG